MVSDALAEIKRVAVLEFRGVDVQDAMLLKLSDQSRFAALEVLDHQKYSVITRENMMQILEDNGLTASCLEGTCEVDIGRNIGADIIVTGDVFKTEGVYYLTLKLFDTHRGRLLAGQDIESESFGDLKKQTKVGSVVLFQQGLKLSPSKKSSLSTSAIQSTDSATVSGGDFSLDVVGQANQLAQQIAQLEKVIKDDLDQKEAEIKAKASRQWNSSDFVQLRRTSPSLAVDSVERFLDAYRNVTVEYPQQVAIPISISLTRKVYIPETAKAQEWLNDELVPQLDECNHNPSKCVSLGYAYDTGTDGKQQNKKIAVRLYQFGCDGGNTTGCTNLGVMYERGQGVSQNYDRALELYRQGCDGGHAGGCTNIGYMYEKGKGVSQDYGMAAELYKQACDGGYPNGCTNLGYMYRDGQGVSQNYGRAMELYKQGCAGGHANGCFGIGYMYDAGKGVSQDYGRAVKLYKQACDGGYPNGCSNLGYMYQYGKGVSQNMSLARKYLRQGCNGGDQWGCDRLKEMD